MIAINNIDYCTGNHGVWIKSVSIGKKIESQCGFFRYWRSVRHSVVSNVCVCEHKHTTIKFEAIKRTKFRDGGSLRDKGRSRAKLQQSSWRDWSEANNEVQVNCAFCEQCFPFVCASNIVRRNTEMYLKRKRK